MPQPTITDVHVDHLLTQISIAYMNDPANFIADDLFPIVLVDFQSNKYVLYTKNDWLRDEAQVRAPATESAGGGYNLDTSNVYNAVNYAFHKDIPDEIRRNADMPIDMDLDATRFVTEKLRLKNERLWAGDFFKDGVWQTDVNGAGGADFTQWSDFANSDPHVDIETGIASIESITGKAPNRFVMGREVWTSLRHHPDVMDKIKYTQTGILAAGLFASLIGVEKVHIGRAIYATNVEGATAAYSFIYGKHGLLLHRAERPGLLTPSAGYTFVWKVFAGVPMFIRRIRDDKAMFDRVEGHIYLDQKRTGQDLGYFLKNAVA